MRGNDPPEDILEINRECSAFIVPGSHTAIWLVPRPHLTHEAQGPQHRSPAGAGYH
jgi:hypothetical protein